MRRIAGLILYFCMVMAAPRAVAQSYYTSSEVGISLGASQYFGDLNDNYGFKTITPGAGIYVRKHLTPYISVKAVANYTQVSYDDKYSTDVYDQERNLNFKSDVIELVAQAEFNFFRFVTGDPFYRFTPYLTGGVGAFYYNPYTTYNGTKYFLRPLGTEGQNAGYNDRKYTNFSACFPIGAGIKFWIRPGVNMSIEVADRLTTTDYLDDVSSTYVGARKFPHTSNNLAYLLQDRSIELSPASPLGQAGKQRGNTSSYDQYLMAMVSISFHFTTYKCPAFMRNDDLTPVPVH